VEFGRNRAGKGGGSSCSSKAVTRRARGTIKRFTEHLNPRGTRVVGFCTPSEYREFMEQTPGLEQALVDSGIHPPWIDGTTIPRRKRP